MGTTSRQGLLADGFSPAGLFMAHMLEQDAISKPALFCNLFLLREISSTENAQCIPHS